MTTPEEWGREIAQALSEPDPGTAITEILRRALTQAFCDGFMAGATAYATKVDHETLMSLNTSLRELRDSLHSRAAQLFVQDCVEAGRKT